MIEQFKNWWFAIIGIAVLILDLGFNVVNPFLLELGLNEKVLTVIKVVFGIYGLIKLKNSMPTKDPDKLKKLADEIVGDRPGNSGGR